MKNWSLGCLEYNDILSHFYHLRGSVEWSSLLSVRLVFGCVYGAILVGGLVGNGGVIGVLVWGRGLTARNVLLLNLMCADLLLCVTAVPITPVVIVWKRWFFGSFMCRCLPLAQSASVMVSSWTLAAIAVDKFVHIHDPTTMPVRKRHALWMVVGGWLVAFVLNLPFALSYQLMPGSEVVQPGAFPFCGEFCVEHWRVESLQWSYGTLVVVVQFGAPILMIIYCYARIFWIIRRDLLVSQDEYSGVLSRLQYRRGCGLQRKATYIMVAMVLAFLIAWTPITVMNMLNDYALVPSFIRDQVYFWGLVSHSLAMSSVVLNPVICFWLTSKSKPGAPVSRVPSVPLHLYTTSRKCSSNTPRSRRRDHHVEGGSLIMSCTAV